MKRLPLARQSGHKDTLTGREAKPQQSALTNPWAPAAGGMLPTHIVFGLSL